jgi:hypothetical protein
MSSCLHEPHQPTNHLPTLFSAARLRFLSAWALRAVARTPFRLPSAPMLRANRAPSRRFFRPAIPPPPAGACRSPCPLLREFGRGMFGGGSRFTRGGFGHLDLANLLPLASRPGCASPAEWPPLLLRSLGAPLALSGLASLVRSPP